MSVESYDMSVSHAPHFYDLYPIIRKHTKSNAATFLFAFVAPCVTVDTPYRPTSRLSFTIRHIIFSGSFLDRGVKKFATALLVVVDCCRRFDGGGETSLLFELSRFPSPGRGGIFELLLLREILHLYGELRVRL